MMILHPTLQKKVSLLMKVSQITMSKILSLKEKIERYDKTQSLRWVM
jgi:hypothetical protein